MNILKIIGVVMLPLLFLSSCYRIKQEVLLADKGTIVTTYDTIYYNWSMIIKDDCVLTDTSKSIDPVIKIHKNFVKDTIQKFYIKTTIKRNFKEYEIFEKYAERCSYINDSHSFYFVYFDYPEYTIGYTIDKIDSVKCSEYIKAKEFIESTKITLEKQKIERKKLEQSQKEINKILRKLNKTKCN